MDSRRLHIWQPVTCLKRAQIVNATLNYTDRGLCLTLIDRNNAIKYHLFKIMFVLFAILEKSHDLI